MIQFSRLEIDFRALFTLSLVSLLAYTHSFLHSHLFIRSNHSMTFFEKKKPQKSIFHLEKIWKGKKSHILFIWNDSIMEKRLLFETIVEGWTGARDRSANYALPTNIKPHTLSHNIDNKDIIYIYKRRN